MRKILLLLFLACQAFGGQREEKVFLIHGFLGAPWNLYFLDKSLRKNGWDTYRWGYPSREKFIKEHAEDLVAELQVFCQENAKNSIHFVVHSMGSLVLLAALNHSDCPEQAKSGRVVLIAPPLQGSSWGRWLYQFLIPRRIAKNYSGYELMTKKSFAELGEFPESLEKILVISGSLSFNPFFKEINDGVLSLEETRPNASHEQIILKRGHKTLIFSKKTCEHILNFLE